MIHPCKIWLYRGCSNVSLMSFWMQSDAIEATTNLLEWELPEEQRPTVSIIQKCHTQMKVCIHAEEANVKEQYTCLCQKLASNAGLCAIMMEHFGRWYLEAVAVSQKAS